MTEHKNNPEVDSLRSAENSSPSAVEQEASSLESVQNELEKMKDQWMRAMADAENGRRRAAKEKEEAQKFAITSFARELLSVADNLHRALENCPTQEGLSEATQALITGIEMTEKELLNVLQRHGVKQIDPLHEKFDPNFHQAMFEIETPGQEAGKIVEVLQCGYSLYERLLRPAMVGVSKLPTPPSQKIDTTA